MLGSCFEAGNADQAIAKGSQLDLFVRWWLEGTIAEIGRTAKKLKSCRSTAEQIQGRWFLRLSKGLYKNQNSDSK